MEITTLDKINCGQSAIIEFLSEEEPFTQRLWNMGITKGSIVIPVFISPLGGTAAYKVKGTLIAMRKINAKNIKVSSYRSDHVDKKP